MTVKLNERKIALYSISTHPIDTTEFCVGGRDQYVRVYDRRQIPTDDGNAFKKLCPHNLVCSLRLQFLIIKC